MSIISCFNNDVSRLRSPAHRVNLLSRFMVFTSGILLALVLVPSLMKAQCPTDILPAVGAPNTSGCGGTYPAWTGPTTTTITVGGCTITVTYCFREILCYPTATDVTWQAHVLSYTAPSGCSLTDQQMSNAITDNPIAFSQTGYSPPPCNNPNYTPWTFVIYKPACISLVQVDNCPDGTRHYADCDDNAAFCTATYTECYQNGGIIWSSPSYSLAGDTPDCADLPTGGFPIACPLVIHCYKPICGD